MAARIKSSGEDYLEAIYNLTQNLDRVRSVDVANYLKVTRPSVNKAMGLLLKAGMIQKLPYGDITLTQAGYERAKNVATRHKALKRFLQNILKIDEATAETEACGMEHAVSNETIAKLTEYLDSQNA